MILFVFGFVFFSLSYNKSYFPLDTGTIGQWRAPEPALSLHFPLCPHAICFVIWLLGWGVERLILLLQGQHFYSLRYLISLGFSVSMMMGRWWCWKWWRWSLHFCSHLADCSLTSTAAITESLLLWTTLKHGLWPILPVLKHTKVFPPFLPVGKLLTENERLTFQKLVSSTKHRAIYNDLE